MYNNKKEVIIFNQGYIIDKQGRVFNPRKQLLNCFINKYGYVIIGVRIDNSTKHIRAHRLQAYIKFGNAMFAPGIVVRHLNDIKTDNTWDNILIGTYSENSMDIPIDLRKSRVLSSVVRKYDYESVISFYNKTKSYKQTMIKFNMPQRSSLTRVLQSQ